MKNNHFLFVVGQGSLAIALMLKYLLANTMFVLILTGIFTTVSIVFNIFLIANKINEIKSRSNKNKAP